MRFSTTYENIIEKIQQIDPLKYGSSRNYIDGAVTYLSPYISRGVISTKQVLENVVAAGFDPRTMENFVMELAWRDYWQQLWVGNKHLINNDFKHPQPLATHVGIPENIVAYKTGIEAIDKGIESLYQTGYLHNHLRMYVASLTCNVAKCHWKIPAQWMYYHLLDADWASNALGWQWVCGANSNKLYYANQENINKYCHTNQVNTFLDVSYEALAQIKIAEVLNKLTTPVFTTPLPQTNVPVLNPQLPTLIYNFYNLDPVWRNDIDANRILLLEPSVFRQYPVSQNSIDFCLVLANDNIPNIQVWVGEFAELQQKVTGDIYYKEHPLNNYNGIEDARDWMTNVKGSFPSFFAFWKQCKKELFK